MPEIKIVPRFIPKTWFLISMAIIITHKFDGGFPHISWWWIMMPVILMLPLYIISFISSKMLTKEMKEDITERLLDYDNLQHAAECTCHECCPWEYNQDSPSDFQTQQTISMYKVPNLSLEWSEFNPAMGYEKEMQDIKLKNGDIVMKCWPNAGEWFIGGEREANKKYLKQHTIPSEDVAMVRLTHSKEW